MQKIEYYPDQIKGLTTEKLEFLCQPSQIETTLTWLWHLNRCQKKAQNSISTYRGKLEKIKSAILRTAYQHNHIKPITYISGLEQFLTFFQVDTIAQELTQGVAQYLEEDFPHLYQMSLPPLPSQGWKGLVGLTVAARFSRWLSTQELPSIPELDAAWILFGHSKEYYRLQSLGLSTPDTLLPSSLSIQVPILAWNIATLENFINQNPQVIADLDAQMTTDYEQHLTEWEEKLRLIETKRSQKLASIADILDQPLEKIYDLLATGEVDRNQLEIWFKKKIQRLLDEAIMTVQPLKTDLFRQLQWPLVISLELGNEPWDDPELEQGLLRLLDPEGFSSIGFEYQTETAHFMFYLPFRVACELIPLEQALYLRSTLKSCLKETEEELSILSSVDRKDLTITKILDALGIEIEMISNLEKELELAQVDSYNGIENWGQMPADLEDDLDVDWDIFDEE